MPSHELAAGSAAEDEDFKPFRFGHGFLPCSFAKQATEFREETRPALLRFAIYCGNRPHSPYTKHFCPVIARLAQTH